jgi:putative two-component system response regulator
MISSVNPAGTTVLVVDDVPENLAVLGELLRSASYRVRVANSGEAALRFAAQRPYPALILLDVMMPDMDGYQVLQQLRQNDITRDIPIIFLTALSEPTDETRGLELGAADYITKPIHPDLMLARVHTQLEAKQARDWLSNRNTLLEAEVARRMAENELVQTVAIRALANLAEMRDEETGNHILRTQRYVLTLAMQLRDHPRFQPVLTPRYIELLVRSAPLHDIGKVGIPDHILLKPGKLTPDEWAVMQTHAELGARAIEAAERDVKQEVEFLVVAKQIARHHHERWDGSGYPGRLAGDQIPVSARLMAIADVFDALVTVRVYKPALPPEKARAIILDGAGSHFDPDVAAAFDATFADFVAIAEQYRDYPDTVHQ